MFNTHIKKKRCEIIFKKISQNTTIEKNFHSMLKNISLKYNFTTHQKNSVNYARIFEKYFYLNEKCAFVMIDSKTADNFISQRLIDK